MSRESDFLKRAYRANLSLFIQRSFSIVSPGDRYLHNWNIDCLAEYLTACKNREITRLCVNVPPRTLKSVSATVAFPAWLLGHNPSERIMTASYAQSLSHKHSQDTRFIMQSEWYKSLFPKTIIASDQNEKRKFMTTERGHRLAVSVGGSATGEGANFLIADDPLNPIQAASDVERKNANDWFSQTFLTRLDDKEFGVIIVIMQRLHQNDVSGMILKQGGYEHLCLPAVNDRTRTITIGKFHKEWKAGELLHPERLTEKVLDDTKLGMGSFSFAGQYMQRPVPEGGGIIKEDWWQRWEGKEPPPTHDIIQVYDTAFTEKTTNDYTARTTWGIFTSEDGEDNIILLERLKKRMEFPELLREAKESYVKYTKRKTGEHPLVLIEEKASGLPLIQEMRRTGLRVRGIKRNANSGDKVSRCHNITHVFENGRIWIPCNMVMIDDVKTFTPKPFAQEVIDECGIFPNGTHDDLVDTVIDAVAYLRKWREIRTDYDKEDVSEYNGENGKKKRYYS